MLKLLHIDSSILGDQSVSRVLAAAIVHRDLVTRPLPHLTADDLLPAAPAVIGEGVLSEFLAADVIVNGVALYNLGVSSQLKAWIDRIVVPGRTFRCTPHGPEGLSRNNRVILAVARGGTIERATPWLRANTPRPTFVLYSDSLA
nr:NAD(P)H-dependent oxidoreductase [Peteryoungia ipomoeae]